MNSNDVKGRSELKKMLRVISEEFWDKSEQAWSSSDICPNCKAQVILKQDDVGTDGKSKIVCAGCGTEGYGKFESGQQWINWKLNPGGAYSKPMTLGK